MHLSASLGILTLFPPFYDTAVLVLIEFCDFQTACALAVAESAFQFEHRDLHWGNVLISCCDKNKKVRFRLNGTDLEVNTYGVEVCIIDFTLSRITHDGVVIYNDLGQDDDLFTGTGDYQFEMYRLMQDKNG